MCVIDLADVFEPVNAENNHNKNLKKNKHFLILDGPLEEDIIVSNDKDNQNVLQNNQGNNELDNIILNTTNVINNLKEVIKKVEINTKITYTYEDDSSKIVNQNETHEFKE